MATPIGHAQDISLRALAVLRQADIVFCEDTRTSATLLRLHQVPYKKLCSLHAHNEQAASQRVVEAVRQGQAVAYISDAGLPLISDPGAVLVRQMQAENLPITSIPGANAALTALQLSGLPNVPFTFVGFLPAKESARREALQGFASIPTTLIFYEAPHRIAASLALMAEVLGGERPAALARELTKFYEEVRHGTLATLSQAAARETKPRGEMVVVVAPPPLLPLQPLDTTTDSLLRAARTTLSARDAAFHVASQTGQKRRDLYQRLMAMEAEATEKEGEHGENG